MKCHCFIGIGKCSKYYLLILGTCLSKFLKQSLFNFFQIYPPSNSGIFGFQPVLYGHFVISSIYAYIGYIIFSLILNLISKKLTKNNDYISETQMIKKRSLTTKSKTFDSQADKISRKKILKAIGICSVFVIANDFIKIVFLYDVGLFNIWTFYIIFILIFMKRHYVVQIFRHQKYSMILVIVVCTILLLLSTFFPYNEQSDKNAYQKVKEITGNYSYFLLFLIIFVLYTCATSFFIVYSKALMEIEMIPPYMIILITGIIGLILNFILLTFTSIFKCTMDNFIKNICITFNKEGAFYDNLLIYFSNLKSIYNDDSTRSQFFIEIFVVYPLYLIFSFLELVCQIFAIYYLNPNYILIYDPIYFGILRMIFLFYNIKTISTFIYIYQFLLLESAEIFAFLGYLVYLEVLELKFCGLDHDLKRHIIYRNDYETNKALNELQIISVPDSQTDIERNDSFVSNDGYII